MSVNSFILTFELMNKDNEEEVMQRQQRFLAALIFSAGLFGSAVHAAPGEGTITLIHTGDFHGHLIPRPNIRSDGKGRMEGGLARIHTVIKKLRAENKHSLLLHTGDTIQGGAEVLYTRGQAIVDILNDFGIDGFAPGNWEFVYGTERFLELFGGVDPKANWNAIAANAYYSTANEEPDSPYLDRAGQLVLPPYFVRQVGDIKVGVMGFTTDRGPQVVSSQVTKGFTFTKGDDEVPKYLDILRNQEKVDLVIMISELGLANNIVLANRNPGIDVILSADMHEETHRAVVTQSGTIVVEEGQDGTMMGALKLKMVRGKIKEWDWEPINITEDIKEDRETARKVMRARRPFVAGLGFRPQVNPFNGSVLIRPIDSIIGYTAKDLHRSNFSHEEMPAVIEGSSHDFLTDAFRAMTGAQIGAIRGFRYGTHIPAGPIRLEDIYHYMPIGPQIAIGTIKGQALKNQIENSADGSLNSEVRSWTGGWLFNFSGVTFDFDPYGVDGHRASNIRVNGLPLDPSASYTYASYWYPRDPTLINRVPATNISVLKDKFGNAIDGTEVVVNYLQTLANKTADPELHRIKLLNPLPTPSYGNEEIQPLRGVSP